MTEEERERERLRYIRESIGRVQQYSEGGQEAFFPYASPRQTHACGSVL